MPEALRPPPGVSAFILPVPSAVTFRINTDRDMAGHIIRIAGRLSREGALELERVLERLTGPFSLDLDHLRSADEAGLDALRALRSRGIPLTGVSRYLRLLLGPRRTTPRRAPRESPENSA